MDRWVNSLTLAGRVASWAKFCTLLSMTAICTLLSVPAGLRAADTIPPEPEEEFVASDSPSGGAPRVEMRATKAQPPSKAKATTSGPQPTQSKRKAPAAKPAAPPLPPAQPIAEPDTSEPATPATSEKQSAPEPTPAAAALDEGDASVAVQKEAEAGEGRRKLNIDLASFKGVQPGHTTAEEVDREWGKPKHIKPGDDGQVEHIYKIDPFDRVSLTIHDNLVTSLLILLEAPLPPDVVAQQLQLDDVKAVTVYDARGQALGQAFPERGVLFTYATDTEEPAVSQIVLEPIDAQTFVLRAEQHAHDSYLASLEDADYAISLNVRNARAHYVRAQILLNMGDLEAALKAAEQSVALEPDTAEFRLQHARILLRAADFTGAQQQLEDVLTMKKLSALLKARAQLELGHCAAQCASPDHAKALKHHQDAIALAETLVSDKRTSVRHGAKLVLIDAHLAIAQDIAAGRWQHKNKVVPKWLDRASAFAEEMISHDQGTSELRLHVSQGALAALAMLSEPPDAQTWIDSLLQIGKEQVDGAEDAAVRASWQWRLAISLSDAMQVEQARRDHESAIDMGKLALEMFKQSGTAGKQLPAHDYLVGRVYYRLGNIEAVDRQQHKPAIAWYDKAVSLLESPLPPSALTDAGQQGEAFISMAVSYWEAGGRDEALRLTRQGVQLLEKAVEESIVSRSALAIPYGNLASMHEEMGQAKEARKYAALAQKCERTEKK